MADVIRQRRDQIMQLADKYGAKNIRVFGSFARGDNHTESDADFLVNMEGSLLSRIMAGMFLPPQILEACIV